MFDNDNKFENYSNFNREKRIKLIENYQASLRHKPVSSFLSDEASFEKFTLDTKFPGFDENESLIEIVIRYSILYLEEFNYELKIKGLELLDHLMESTSPSLLNLNMRSRLILSSFERYINDKDGSVIFLDKQMESMRRLLNLIETSYSSGEHNYKQHSIVFDSMLNNCYMTTNQTVKTIYFKNLIFYIIQMNVYTCRHLEKLLTVAFDCGLDNSKINFDFEGKKELLDKCLELLDTIIITCSLRIHFHSRRIFNFLLKLAYFSCLDNRSKEQEKITALLKQLQHNNTVKDCYRKELTHLIAKKNYNSDFLKLIETILN